MKKGRIVISVVLLLMIVSAWGAQVTGGMRRTEEYDDSIKYAEFNTGRGLYQKAILSYEYALEIRESEDVRQKWLDAYENAFEDGVIPRKDYIGAMERFCSLYPKRVDLWEQLIEEALDGADYSTAERYYQKAVKAGAKSEKLSELKNEIYYSFSENGRIYTQVIEAANGYCAVSNDKNWGVMNPEGEWLFECEYSYTGPAGQSDLFFVRTEDSARIFDQSKVVQAVIDEEWDRVRMISDSIVPVCRDGKWWYYDYTRDEYVLESYDDATSFCGGEAAVKLNGKWRLVSKDGNLPDTPVFDDIVMLDSGEWVYDGIFIGAVDGEYGIYSADKKEPGGLKAKNMDCYLGGPIAYQDNDGKWGFVDQKGNIEISPRFEEAKSFSGGLAAVKVDGTWGFINQEGQLVIENRFVEAGYFTSAGSCFVSAVTGEFYRISLRF